MNYMVWGSFLELVIEKSWKSVRRPVSTAQRNNDTVVISWSFGRLTTTGAGCRTQRCSFSIRTRCNICKRASNCVNNIQKCVPEKKKMSCESVSLAALHLRAAQCPATTLQCFCRCCVSQPVWRVGSHTFYIFDWLGSHSTLKLPQIKVSNVFAWSKPHFLCICNDLIIHQFILKKMRTLLFDDNGGKSQFHNNSIFQLIICSIIVIIMFINSTSVLHCVIITIIYGVFRQWLDVFWHLNVFFKIRYIDSTHFFQHQH